MRTPLAIGSTALLAFLGGCFTPGGGLMPYTGGATTYYSPQNRPKTITIVDTRTGEMIFSLAIPAGQQLTLDFLPDDGDDPVERPDLMRYQIWPIGTTTGRLTNAMSVPNAACRRIDVTFRPGPEYATAPPERHLRSDRPADRPDWWSPKGGPVPDESPVDAYDD